MKLLPAIVGWIFLGAILLLVAQPSTPRENSMFVIGYIVATVYLILLTYPTGRVKDEENKQEKPKNDKGGMEMRHILMSGVLALGLIVAISLLIDIQTQAQWAFVDCPSSIHQNFNIGDKVIYGGLYDPWGEYREHLTVLTINGLRCQNNNPIWEITGPDNIHFYTEEWPLTKLLTF